jgi:hypothetical protein
VLAAGTSTNTGKSSGTGMAALQTFAPEDFGAAGDGVTNDSAAFERMANAVTGAGGGKVILRKTTYIVGGHVADPTLLYAFAPAPIMRFIGCAGSLTIVGNGARLRCADGLRFGTFDRTTGLPTHHPMPYYGTGELAAPYSAMVHIENCTGKVIIENIELDGNLANLRIGGQYGDQGWQIPAYGLRLINNAGAEHVAGVFTHHHAVDGLLIDGAAERTTSSVIENVTSEYNARQGCSLIGGRNYSFENCKFNHTGKAGMASAPGAGFDVEAETSPIRDITFVGCEFANNSGPGMGADSGDSENVTFSTCRFVGTTMWAAWPRKPRFRFYSCEFVGSICNTYGDPDPERAVQFHNCAFRDDPALSPTGQVYTTYPIADLSDFQNVLFKGCNFQLTHEARLPWSTGAIYSGTRMSQVTSKQAYPRGTYRDVNRIDGNVDLYGSRIVGSLTVNGQVVALTS